MWTVRHESPDSDDAIALLRAAVEPFSAPGQFKDHWFEKFLS